MNSLIVASGVSQQGVTMSSNDLLVYVNDARKWLGEPVVANRHFLSRIEDELEGELPPRKSFTHPNNGASVSYYDLTEDQCKLVAMRESKAVRRRVLAKLKELESRQLVTIPQSYAEALLEAGRLAKITEEQAAQLAIAAPKAEFVDKYVEATGLKGFRQVAKLLKANEARFREFLIDKKIMYRLSGEWMAYQNHIDAGRFDVKTGSSDSGHAFNQTKFTPKGVNWIAGLWAQHNLQEADHGEDEAKAADLASQALHNMRQIIADRPRAAQ